MNTTILETTKFYKLSFTVPVSPELDKDFEKFKKFVGEKMNEIYGVSGEALNYDVSYKWEEVTLDEFNLNQGYEESPLSIGDAT